MDNLKYKDRPVRQLNFDEIATPGDLVPIYTKPEQGLRPMMGQMGYKAHLYNYPIFRVIDNNLGV